MTRFDSSWGALGIASTQSAGYHATTLATVCLQLELWDIGRFFTKFGCGRGAEKAAFTHGVAIPTRIQKLSFGFRYPLHFCNVLREGGGRET